MQKIQILADSLNSETGDRLTTFLLHRFPKCLLAELNTHRVFSRNAASSRAMPIKKVIEQIKADPFIPVWTSHQAGMQGGESLSDRAKESATHVWLSSRDEAIERVEQLLELGIAKQNANRLLEPWLTVPVLVTATDWENFWELRCDPGAQPEFRAIALEMRESYGNSKPLDLKPGEWHIPFREGIPIVVSDGISENVEKSLSKALQIATARAARLSYQNHMGLIGHAKDFELHDRLLESKHLSPFEHCAQARPTNGRWRNFSGFRSYRAHLEGKEGDRQP